MTSTRSKVGATIERSTFEKASEGIYSPQAAPPQSSFSGLAAKTIIEPIVRASSRRKLHTRTLYVQLPDGNVITQQLHDEG